MLKKVSLSLQIAAVLAIPWLAIPHPAFAENPLPVASPAATKYERFADFRNQDPSSPVKRLYDEEERGNASPARDEKEQPLAPATGGSVAALPLKTYSALETMYSGRVDSELRQFGYDLFGVPAPETQATLNEIGRQTPQMPMGAVQDDFILQAGDELDIAFTGQRTARGLYKVNSQGLLIIEDMPPVPAAGRSIGQVRLSVIAAARNLHNTDAYVSLSSVRQIGVLVMGHVKRPGRQTLTVFHTVIDALMEAGGVDKTGSLRQIKLVRGGNSDAVDLYALLMRGSAGIDLQLRDGDRIIVPSIGPTVAIAGEIKRPGIYEIQPRADKLSLAEMLELGGGILSPGRNRFLSLEVTRSGHEMVSDLDEAARPVFGDGSVLIVAKGQEKRAGLVEITGHTRRPGLYAIDETPSLAKLLPSPDILGPDAYPLIGVIERRDASRLARELIAFPPSLVLKGEHDEKLQDGDKIHIFSDSGIRRLDRPGVKNAAPGENGENDLLQDEIMASFLKERSAFVRGAIRSPGAYPLAEGVTLGSLLAVAGGPTVEADTSRIEVTAAPKDQAQTQGSPKRRSVDLKGSEDLVIRTGDAVRIGQKFRRVEDKSVLVIGEVKNPGRYDLLPGDKVSDLMTRAGGLTDQAYPDGAIFSRESERKAEEARFRAQAREMQSAIAATLEQGKDKISADQIAQARALALELEQAQGVGRITLEADPYILQREPDLDMLLEPGDRLYIPKQSLTVRVSGEILSPVTLQFRKSKEPDDYIDEAGGFTHDADRDRAFVLYPDGSAQSLSMGRWDYDDGEFIPPGSTIIVPRDPKPFSFIESAKDVSQILSNLAITALFIDDVRDDN